MNTKQLRQKILDLAIRGKLVPQDPNDEPAEVLLERVRAEKERLIKEGKIRREKVKTYNNKSFFEKLPDGWAWCHLIDCCIDIADVDHKMPQQVDDGIPYVATSNFTENGIDFSGAKKISMDDYESLSQRIKPEKGDIIFPRYGTIGVLRIVEVDFDFLVSYSCATIKTDKKNTDYKYLFYALQSTLTKEEIKKYINDTTQANVGIKSIKIFRFPLPPLAEQQRIVAAIESAFAVIDEIERNKIDLQAAVIAAKQKILSLAIRGKLVLQDPNDEPASVLLEQIGLEKERLVKEGQIRKEKPLPPITEGDVPFDVPEGWVWTRLGSVAFYKKGPFGSSITKSMFVPESDSAIKIYEQKNAIYKDAFLGSYYISSEKFEELKGFEVFPNDIIVSCAGTIGETYVMPSTIRRGIINQALMRIMLYDKAMKDFYLLYFDFALKADAQKHAKGTAIKNIPRFDILKQFLIPLPPLAEQQRIVVAIETAFEQLDRITAELI